MTTSGLPGAITPPTIADLLKQIQQGNQQNPYGSTASNTPAANPYTASSSTPQTQTPSPTSWLQPSMNMSELTSLPNFSAMGSMLGSSPEGQAIWTQIMQAMSGGVGAGATPPATPSTASSPVQDDFRGFFSRSPRIGPPLSATPPPATPPAATPAPVYGGGGDEGDPGIYQYYQNQAQGAVPGSGVSHNTQTGEFYDWNLDPTNSQGYGTGARLY